MHCTVSTRQTIVADNGFVTVLADQMEVRLVGRYVHMFLVLSVLDEDEPRLGAVGWGRIHSGMYCTVVARAILGNDGIIKLPFYY